MIKPMTKALVLTVVRTHKFPVILTFALILLSYASQGNDLKKFLGLMVLIPIFTLYRFDGRIPIGFALLTLVFAAIVLSLNQSNLAHELALRCYFLLIVGISCLIIEFIRKMRSSKNISKNEFAS